MTFSKPGTIFCDLVVLVPNLPFSLLLLLIAIQGLASFYFWTVLLRNNQSSDIVLFWFSQSAELIPQRRDYRSHCDSFQGKKASMKLYMLLKAVLYVLSSWPLSTSSCEKYCNCSFPSSQHSNVRAGNYLAFITVSWNWFDIKSIDFTYLQFNKRNVEAAQGLRKI